MYKYILTAIIVAIFAGCSAPKPETAPAWYTTLPKDFNYFYATGADVNTQKAKKQAIASLRKQINTQLDNAFKNKTTKLKIDTNEKIDTILKENEYFANRLSMRSVKVEKTASYKNDQLVLIKLSRKDVFDLASRSVTKKLENSKYQYKRIENEIAIEKYIVILDLMKIYPNLASLIEAKKVALPSYDTYDEFNYLNTLKSSYSQLKKDITFYVLTDVNSRVFAPALKNAIKSTGLLLSSKPTSKDALKLLITSKTTNTQNYSFNQSKSLVKFTTYDANKKQVSFKQHTFIGKSRKNYKEAKQQSALHVKGKISKVGIFDFLGFKQ